MCWTENRKHICLSHLALQYILYFICLQTKYYLNILSCFNDFLLVLVSFSISCIMYTFWKYTKINANNVYENQTKKQKLKIYVYCHFCCCWNMEHLLIYWWAEFFLTLAYILIKIMLIYFWSMCWIFSIIYTENISLYVDGYR